MKSNNVSSSCTPIQKIDSSFYLQSVKQSIIFRYIFFGTTTLLFFLIQKDLPFNFPGLLYVCYAALCFNAVIHLLVSMGCASRQVFLITLFFDIALSPFSFHFTGGFLSPLVILHLFSSIKSGGIQSDKKVSMQITLLLASYVTVAFLHKFGVFENSVHYSRTMMQNSAFFYTITGITAFLIGYGPIVIKRLLSKQNQFIAALLQSVDSVANATSVNNDQSLFSNLALSGAQICRVRCMVIAQLHSLDAELETVGICIDKATHANFRQPITTTIANEILSHPDTCLHSVNVLKRYHKDPLSTLFSLRQMYGLQLKNTHGTIIGFLYAVHDKPVAHLDTFTKCMQVFATRAAAELEKKITEENRALFERHRAHAQKMKAISHLSTGIAHDFNNIISAINGYAGLLRKRLAPDSRDYDFVEHIIQAGNNASEITAQLSLLVTEEHPSVRPVNVDESIQTTISLLKAKYGNGFTFPTECKAKSVITEGDPALLQNLFMNLGTNACDAHGSDSGTVSFSLIDAQLDESDVLCRSFNIKAGNYLHVDITDSGIGMEEELLSRMFDPFFSTKSKEKGAGLGLVNVWKYIKSYKGAITVESTPNVGTTVNVFLPVYDGQPQQRIQPTETTTAQEITLENLRKTVLIVDDEESVREIYSEILSDNGFEVFTSVDGLDALEFINRSDRMVDVVLLDMVMPRMNGPDTFKALRKNLPEIKVILMSGMSRTAVIDQILKEPGTLFFQKPCDDEQLLHHIQSMLENKETNSSDL